MPKRKRSGEVTPEPTLPSFEPRLPGTEYDTPHRAGAQAIWAWEEYNGRKPNNDKIFRFLNIQKTQGYQILQSDTARSLAGQPGDNPRHQPQKVSSEKAAEIVHLLATEDDAQHLTWQQLGQEVGVEASEQTVHRAMAKEGIVTAIAKRRPGIPVSLAEKRIERARGQLKSHPTADDWKNVLFLDEVYFGWSDQGRLYIKRPIGTRDQPRHIQHPREPRDKDRKRFHCWAAVGWNFKSDIYFYDSGNENGKMTQKAYIEQILEPVVKPLLDEGRFCSLRRRRLWTWSWEGQSGPGMERSSWTTALL